uniref:Uncharacterized protein n=1 Tax=Eutreptiella gymnastica TaxID=73025 RepID=A0A7S4LDY4_9EUGL
MDFKASLPPHGSAPKPLRCLEVLDCRKTQQVRAQKSQRSGRMRSQFARVAAAQEAHNAGYPQAAPWRSLEKDSDRAHLAVSDQTGGSFGSEAVGLGCGGGTELTLLLAAVLGHEDVLARLRAGACLNTDDSLRLCLGEADLLVVVQMERLFM